MKEQEHLSGEELDRLVSRPDTALALGSLLNSAKRARLHLEICRACRELLSMHQQADRELGNLKERKGGHPDSNCPEQSELRELAAGIASRERQEQLMEHVMSCDHCAPIFRETTGDFSDETNAEEETKLATLKISKPAFQEQLSRKLAARAKTAPSWVPPKARVFPLWAYGAVATVLAVFISSMILLRVREDSVDDLLARAYSEQRPFELRFRNARYAPLRVERGSRRSRFERPSALLKAEALLAERMKAAPNDPVLLQARARSELLEGDYQAAIGSLEQAIGANPTASLLTDLGSAYYLRAEKEQRVSDYGSAIEQFGRALSAAPDDQVSLFNRALAEEHLLLYEQALDDWEHYLRVDPRGGWAIEGRHHLEILQNGIQEQKKKASFLKREPLEPFPKNLRDDVASVTVDEHLEAYFKVAETRWLPAIYSREKRNRETAAGLLEDVQLVAKVAKTKHHDPWLSDLLRTPASPILAEAYQMLAQSMAADDKGDYLLALKRSRRAELMFRSAGNRAGELRAEVEKVATLRLTDANIDCVSLAGPLADELAGRHYRWLESQLLLENAICFDLVGNEGAARALALKAEGVARDSGYPTSYLRSLGLSAGLEATAGNTDAGWKLTQEGLAIYWSGGYPLMRRYSLLDAMELLAEKSREPLLQVTVLKEAAATIDDDSDLMLRAVAHDQLAKCAMKAGLPGLAETNFKSASKLFKMCPPNRVTFSRQADEEIWLAEAETRLGKYESASGRLANVREQVLSSPYRYGLDRYFQAVGELQLKVADLRAAESSFRSAVMLAEVGLRSLKSEAERMEWKRDHAEAYKNWINVRLRQQDAEGAFALWEWFKGAPLRSFRKDSSIAVSLTSNLDGTRSIIFGHDAAPPQTSELLSDAMNDTNSGSTLLSFAKLPAGYTVWIVNQRGIRSRLIPAASEEVDRVVRHFTRSCSNPASDPVLLRREGRAIYDLLIAPIADQLRQGTVIFEGDGAIAELPVQALVDRDGHYLSETFDLVWSEGLYYEATLRPGSVISPQSSLLAVAVPEGERTADNEPLPDAIEEAAAISKKFVSPRLLVGSDATMERVRRELSEVVVFHYSGHAGLGPSGIGVILSHGSGTRTEPILLTADELPAARLNRLQLAVLSACSTEMGKNAGIADPESLIRALLRAGVPHVVGTRWNLDSRSGATFAEKFYDSLLAGNNPARALTEAAAKVRSFPETSHPYYWAGFNIFGRT